MSDAPLVSSLQPPAAFGDALDPAPADIARLRYLARRRSTPMALMGGPGPNRAQINDILQIAARVPDHGKLAPWRFILLLEDARAKFGAAFAEAMLAKQPDMNPDWPAMIRGQFLRAPVVIAVVSSPKQHPKIPIWEQELSAGAVCMNILLAAQALGFGGAWLTEPPAYDPDAARLLGLSGGERIAGFMHLGTAKDHPKERERPDLSSLVSEWR